MLELESLTEIIVFKEMKLVVYASDCDAFIICPTRTPIKTQKHTLYLTRKVRLMTNLATNHEAEGNDDDFPPDNKRRLHSSLELIQSFKQSR